MFGKTFENYRFNGRGRKINKKVKTTITFVCTGNTCRSVMAERILKDMAKNYGLKNFKIQSAGTAAMPHYSIFGDLARVMEENELDYSDHTPTRINEEIMKSSDLVLVMTQKHKNFLSRAFGYEEKTFLLTEFSGRGRHDITDPIGRGLEAYRKAFKEIKENLKDIIERMQDEFEK
ncbi:MAG: low molecular weight protein arginine phosphatase [Elusimicrobiota bacterium]